MLGDPVLWASQGLSLISCSSYLQRLGGVSQEQSAVGVAAAGRYPLTLASQVAWDMASLASGRGHPQLDGEAASA